MVRTLCRFDRNVRHVRMLFPRGTLLELLACWPWPRSPHSHAGGPASALIDRGVRHLSAPRALPDLSSRSWQMANDRTCRRSSMVGDGQQSPADPPTVCSRGIARLLVVCALQLQAAAAVAAPAVVVHPVLDVNIILMARQRPAGARAAKPSPSPSPSPSPVPDLALAAAPHLAQLRRAPAKSSSQI